MKKKILFVFVLLTALVLSGCGPDQSTQAINTEQQQQGQGVLDIVRNQPVPNLGGYSFPRQVVIETYIALNKPTPTWSYIFSLDGKLIELCPSYGYPIPGGTELTNPVQTMDGYNHGSVIANPEPNGLYPPSTSAGTLVNCVNSDGTTSPIYVEPEVIALPYRIKSDIQISRVDNSAPSIAISPQTKP